MFIRNTRLRNNLRALRRKYLSIVYLPSVTRVSLDYKLKPLLRQIEEGKSILEIGSSNYEAYRECIAEGNYYTSDIVDHENVDIVGDIHNLEWESNYFDVVIGIEILEHLYDPRTAIQEVFRLLKPGGFCILSTRFMFPYHPCDKDYYRFTKDSLEDLCSNFEKVEIQHHGNGIQVFWQMITYKYPLLTYLLKIFNPILGRIEFKNTIYPSGFIVKVTK